MKRTLLIAIFTLISMLEIQSQSIRIERTDVDSSRLNFVTATLKFGFNVYLDNVQSANGAAFQLNYTRNDVIKFSEWQAGDFGKPIVHSMTNPDGSGRIVVGVTRGTNPLADSIKSAKILHLEFVVLQTARNLDTSIFNFFNPVATIQKNGVGETVTLTSNPINFAIHSFVNVWPGDADNNGKVDHIDFAPVSQFNGLGSMTKNMRSFKRKSQSSIWAGHRVLTWDSAAVTYADCDGNGEITYSDMLIVSYNLGKDTINKSINKFDGEIQGGYPIPERFEGSNLVRIPIRFKTTSDFLAGTGKINLQAINNFGEILGVEPSEIFGDLPFCFYKFDADKQHIEFITGSYVKELQSAETGVLANLVLKPNFPEPTPNVLPENLLAINENGTIFVLNSTVSDVTEQIDEKDITIVKYMGMLEVKNSTDSSFDIKIFNIQGELIDTNKIDANQTIKLPLTSFKNGVYIFNFSNETTNINKKVVILK